MLLLALDTSTSQASLALCSEEELLGEYTWQVGNNHSVELVRKIQRLMADCGLTMQAIDGVAVATGPGSFNGLRVALATAKALAFALQKPLVGVSTLDIIAAEQQQWDGLICAMVEAGRTELYAACYICDKVYTSPAEVAYHVRRLSEYLLLSPSQIGKYLQEQVSTWAGIPGERNLPTLLFCGEISAVSRQALFVAMREKSIFVNTVQAIRHASVLARLALQRLREGKIDNPLQLEPLYVRRPSITSSTRKQPLLDSKANRPTSLNTFESHLANDAVVSS